MDEWLKKNFEIPSKNATPKQQREWRSHVSLVKNPRRRFRNVADLDKRSEAEEKKKEIREKLKAKRAQME